MATVIKNDERDLRIRIGLKEGQEWSKEKTERVKAFVKEGSAKRTPAQILKNELLSIKYQMEEYIEESNDRNKPVDIDVFLKVYLVVLKITFKKFAESIDTSDSNLKKYVSGERRFNSDLALKFGHFFHTPPNYGSGCKLKMN